MLSYSTFFACCLTSIWLPTVLSSSSIDTLLRCSSSSSVHLRTEASSASLLCVRLHMGQIDLLMTCDSKSEKRKSGLLLQILHTLCQAKQAMLPTFFVSMLKTTRRKKKKKTSSYSSTMQRWFIFFALNHARFIWFNSAIRAVCTCRY